MKLELSFRLVFTFHLFLFSKNNFKSNQHFLIHPILHTNQKFIADSDRANNNSLIAHISSLPGFDASKARFVKQYSTKSSPEKSALEILPTAAELMLPWRRDRSYQSLGTLNLQKKSLRR